VKIHPVEVETISLTEIVKERKKYETSPKHMAKKQIQTEWAWLIISFNNETTTLKCVFQTNPFASD